jgi:hypothetical protein
MWLDSQGYRFGAIVSPQALFDLGSDWYATRLGVDWQPATASEAQAMFDKHGLQGTFWSLSG